MKSFAYHPDACTLDAIGAALRSVPRAAYSVPHDYPSSAPPVLTITEPRPRAGRPASFSET